MKHTRHIVFSLWLIAAFVQAQTGLTSYQDPQQAFSIAHPADWQVETDEEGVKLNADGDTGFFIYAERLEPENLKYFRALTPGALADLTSDGMRQELPDFQVVEKTDVRVGGFPATALRYNATDPETQVPVTGRMVVFVSQDRFFILVSSSDVDTYPQYEPVLEQMHASFTLTAQALIPDIPPVDNPLDTSSEVRNPLDLRTPAPFVGTFVSDRLTLLLDGDGEAYRGQLTFGGQTFLVTAQGTASELTGTFGSEGNAFSFTATLSGDTLTFVTEGTRYILQKEALNANPLRP